MRRALLALGGVMLLGAGAALAAPYAAYDTFARALTQVLRGHADVHDEGDLVYRALSGLAGALDPHSAFYPPAEAARLAALDAAAVDFGLIVAPVEGGWRVVELVPGGAGEVAGLRRGDRVVAVDDVAGAPLPPPGTALARLRVARDGRVYDVPLAAAAPRPVAARDVGDVRVLRITGFPPGAAEQAVAALQAAPAPRGVVLDLRGNPGGRPEEAVLLVDAFVRSGRILRARGRLPAANVEHVARDDGGEFDGPVVVLVDERTASAAEIVAGALQALGRARIVGQATHGKGTVQTDYRYEDGSVLRLTIARWELPPSDRAAEGSAASGGRILGEGRGLIPDVPVPRGPREEARAIAEELAEGPDTPHLRRARDRLLALAEGLPTGAGEADVALGVALGEVGLGIRPTR